MRNPFITTGHIPDEYFCDRVAETTTLVRNITNGANTCLISQRRMGKSKLVMHSYAQKEIAERYYTFYVDVLHTTSLREMTYAFGSTVFNTLKGRNSQMLTLFTRALRSIGAHFGFDAMTGLPTFNLEIGDIAKPEFTLAEIFECLENADKPCVVTFDEFQQIAHYPEKNIEALLRSHTQHLKNVRFVFAGSERHMLSEMFLSSARPFYNSTSIIELHPIEQSIYTAFVQRWMTAGNRSIDVEDIKHVYGLFEGNTYYMQKMFHELYANSNEGDTCGREAIAHTTNSMVEEASMGYRYMLSQMSEKQKELLYAIASEGRAEKITSGSFIKRYALASASSVQAAAKKLLEMEIITVSDGAYMVCDELLRLFLLRLRG